MVGVVSINTAYDLAVAWCGRQSTRPVQGSSPRVQPTRPAHAVSRPHRHAERGTHLIPASRAAVRNVRACATLRHCTCRIKGSNLNSTGVVAVGGTSSRQLHTSPGAASVWLAYNQTPGDKGRDQHGTQCGAEGTTANTRRRCQPFRQQQYHRERASLGTTHLSACVEHPVPRRRRSGLSRSWCSRSPAGR